MGEAEAAEDAVHVLLGVAGFGSAWLWWLGFVTAEVLRCGRGLRWRALLWRFRRQRRGELGVGDGGERAEFGVEDDVLEEGEGGVVFEVKRRSRSLRFATG